MRGLFVAGSDTGIGKTTIALGLMAALQQRGLKVAGYKPVAAGCEQGPEGWRNDDALRLAAQGSIALPYAEVNPIALPEPVSPHLAAARAGVSINLRSLRAGFDRLAGRGVTVVVEGAGGWRVPVNECETMADLARDLALPVVLVVGMRLGCLNHALLTAEAIRADRLTLAGWVANLIDPHMRLPDENIATLRARLPAPLLGVVPQLAQPDPAAVAALLATGRLTGL